ncbi:hypothetical protein diail_5211 [Diaporthe ilicicola]|nr:hypothetical protein diail_5211 [Diaporthe ilicicola]
MSTQKGVHSAREQHRRPPEGVRSRGRHKKKQPNNPLMTPSAAAAVQKILAPWSSPALGGSAGAFGETRRAAGMMAIVRKASYKIWFSAEKDYPPASRAPAGALAKRSMSNTWV